MTKEQEMLLDEALEFSKNFEQQAKDWEHPSHAISTIVRCNKTHTQSE